MTWLTTLVDWLVQFNSTNPWIDVAVVLLVIAGGFFAKKYLAELPVKLTWLTLVTGAVFVGLYAIFLQPDRSDYAKYFLSYCVATSMYELIIKEAVTLVNKAKRAK